MAEAKPSTTPAPPPTQGSVTVDVPTDVMTAAGVEAARVPIDPETGRPTPGQPAQDSRSVIIDGVHYVVPTGTGVSVPADVAEVLAQSANPVRTAQMAGIESTVVDLRPSEAAPKEPKATTTSTTSTSG